MEKTYFLKSAYSEFTVENIDSLIKYLNGVGGKPLTSKCKRQNAFKVSWTEKETQLLARCHVQNAAEYLNDIRNKITKAQLRTVVADIADYVEFLDSKEDTTFILLSTNTQPSAVQFDSASRLFYNHQIREQNQNNYSTDLLTLYAIRLSLESRVRGLLGIDYATTKGKTIGLSTLIKISKNIKTVKYSSETDWTEIEWVNIWLNHHMHRHLRPYPWIIHQSLEVLKPFVDPKNTSSSSFYSATYVKDESALEKEIEGNLQEQFPEVKIRWLNKREIVTEK